MMHIELPVVSFLCALLVLVPLPWHWRARNIATVSISFWLFVSNLINGINAIVWAGNLRIVGGVWCDIATKIVVGGNVALPASVFALCLHLERISSGRPVISSEHQKRCRLYVDWFLCFGIAFIYMATHYVVQGHRFDIVENLGCRPTFYVSLPSIFLIWVPPLIFSIVACVLSGLAFRNFWLRRIVFARHLQSSNSVLTPSHYFRLMSMALIQMFWSILITSLNMWFSTKDGLHPWLNWADVHFDFYRVDVISFAIITPDTLTFMFLLWWAIPVSSLLYFVFFALGAEARKQYGKYFWWLTHCWSRVREHLPVMSRQTVIPHPSLPIDIKVIKHIDDLKDPSLVSAHIIADCESGVPPPSLSICRSDSSETLRTDGYVWMYLYVAQPFGQSSFRNSKYGVPPEMQRTSFRR